jgi:hypothetical protein
MLQYKLVHATFFAWIIRRCCGFLKKRVIEVPSALQQPLQG